MLSSELHNSFLNYFGLQNETCKETLKQEGFKNHRDSGKHCGNLYVKNAVKDEGRLKG
jgi:hypothetical protein